MPTNFPDVPIILTLNKLNSNAIYIGTKIIREIQITNGDTNNQPSILFFFTEITAPLIEVLKSF